MAQLLGNCSFPNQIPSDFAIPTHDSNVEIDGLDESSRYRSLYQCDQHRVINDGLAAMDYCMMENRKDSSQVHFLTNNVAGVDLFLDHDASNDTLKSNEKVPDDVLEGKTLQLGKVYETPILGPSREVKVTNSSEMPLKRSRIHEEASPDQINMRNVKLKKCPSLDFKSYENSNNYNAVLLKRSSLSWCSVDENASLELNEAATSRSTLKHDHILNLNGKARASRGSATDPQSLYARKRRERINERLRILQGIIPNGTKVDISTMLDEAVQYVKFLQLQIKLLSSDDLWMYAPIAYNGMDIGIDVKIPLPKANSQT